MSAIVVCVISIAIPSVYYAISVNGAQKALSIEASFLAKSIENVIQDRPELWEFANERLKEVISKSAIDNDNHEKEIRNAAGKLVTNNDFTESRPIISVSSAFFDSGRLAGSIVIRHSIRTQIIITALLGTISSLLGFLLYFGFRIYPLRKLENTFIVLQRERDKSDKTLHAIGDGVISVDLEGKILLINRVAESLVGMDTAEAAGRRLEEVYVLRQGQEKQVGKRGCILTGKGGSEHAIEEVRTPLAGIESDDGGVVIVFRDITERKRAEEALQQAHDELEQRVAERTEEIRNSEERFRLLFDSATDGILVIDIENRQFKMGNRTICTMLGYSQEEIQHLGITNLHPAENLPYVIDMFERQVRGEQVASLAIPMRRKDGSVFHADITSTQIIFGDRRYVVGYFRDVTGERILQKQVQTAQRMESVGTLAGGIAHDFNNALTGIVGFGELLRVRMAGDEQALHDLDEILRCAERASMLTRQLLTYARRQIIEPVNLSLSALVADLMKLIGKVVGEHIEVKTSLEKNVPTIHADRGQIEQVVMNLCLNAKDAMPKGGRLVVETGDVSLDEEYALRNPYMKTGRYALLTVSDTGIGMDQKTQERVFEPFFTTKGLEKGTGLGLAMVYGIVKQHGGFIHLYSEPGIGTTFNVYFPAIEARPDAVPAIRRDEIARGGTETILLAEDEEALRELAERILTGFGYTVLVARNGEEAIEMFRQHKEIALAVLDVVMPRKGGREAFEEMHKQNPRLKVIFMSGYSVNAIHDSFVLIPGTPFLQKPFGPTILARKVREVLDAR